jgi:hypothetical protein
LRDLTQVEVDVEVSSLVLHGHALDGVALGVSGEGPWALLDRCGELLAVYERTDSDRIMAACVLGPVG